MMNAVHARRDDDQIQNSIELNREARASLTNRCVDLVPTSLSRMGLAAWPGERRRSRELRVQNCAPADAARRNADGAAGSTAVATAAQRIRKPAADVQHNPSRESL